MSSRDIDCTCRGFVTAHSCSSFFGGVKQVLHSIPLFHRDIRWANIVQSREDSSKWILIDWEDSAAPPTTGDSRFNLIDHPPRIHEDNHGPEVDIWAIGHLILTYRGVDLSPEFRVLGRQICKEAHVLKAADVLALVKLLLV